MRTSVAAVLALALCAPPRTLAADERPSGSALRSRAVAKLRIGLERSEARVGESITISVSTEDADGAPADAHVTLDCDFGQLGAVARVAQGLYGTTLVVPKRLPSAQSILLFARADAVSSESVLSVIPGTAAAMTLSAPGAVHVGAAASAQLEVTLTDAYGNAAEDAPRATATRGALRAPEHIGPGRWAISYVPDPALEDAEEVLTLEAGPLRRTQRIRLTTSDSWVAVGPWSGAVLAGGTAGLAVGAEASWWRRLGESQLGAVLDLGWWSLGERTSVPLPGGATELQSERSALPFTASVAWGLQLGPRAAGWIALGGGAALVSSTQKLEGQPAIREVGWSPAAGATAGLGLRAWRGLAFVELRGLWIDDPGLETLRGTSWPVLLLAGYRFDAR